MIVGVFLVMTIIAMIPVYCFCSVNTFITVGVFLVMTTVAVIPINHVYSVNIYS